MSDYLVLRPSQFEDSIEYDVMLPLPYDEYEVIYDRIDRLRRGV